MSLIFEDTQISFTEDNQLITSTTLSANTSNSPLYQILKGGKLPPNSHEEETQPFLSDLVLSSTNRLVFTALISTITVVLSVGLIVFSVFAGFGGYTISFVAVVCIGGSVVLYWSWKDFFVSPRNIRISAESRAIFLEYIVKKRKMIDIEDIDMPFISVGTDFKYPFMAFTLCIPNRRGPRIEHQLAVFETKFAESKPLSAKDKAELEKVVSQARQVVQFMRLKSQEDQPTALQLRYDVQVGINLSTPE